MQISKQVGLGQDSVSKWSTRFIKALPVLQEVAEKDPSRLEDMVAEFLDDNPRPGQPSHYTDEQIIKILEVACRNPEEFGYEASHWSQNLLAAAVVKEGIVESISAKTIGQFLKYGKVWYGLWRSNVVRRTNLAVKGSLAYSKTRKAALNSYINKTTEYVSSTPRNIVRG